MPGGGAGSRPITVIESARLEDESIVLVFWPYERIRRRCPVCGRAFRDLRASRGGSRCDGVRRIGIDETSYGKGRKYLMVVVDHDWGRLIWAAALLDDRPHRAAHRGIGKVVEVERKVRRRRDDIPRAVEPGIDNARVGATNDKVKVTVRMGYGFGNIDNLMALLRLRCSDIEPILPWERPVHVGRAA